jgi:hypothetical protein
VIGATTTQATSAAHPFDSTSPGNIVNVILGAGCTVQRAQVVSVSGATATFDKSLGTAASTCTGNLGGAMLTHTAVWAVAVTGNTVWTKAGTYTITAAFGSAASITWIGYNTTHGDIMGANLARPLITSSTNSVGIYNPSGNPEVMKNISLSTTAATKGIWGFANSGNGATVTIVNSKIDGFAQGYCGQGGNCGATASSLNIVDTEILNSGTNAIVWGAGLSVKNSWIHGNGTGITCVGQIATGQDSSSLNLDSSIVSGGPNCAISITGNSVSVNIARSTIFGAGTIGVSITATGSASPPVYIEGNIIYGSGTYNISFTSPIPSGTTYINKNGLGGAGTANYNNGSGTNDVALSAGPFTNSGANDYSLNSTVGGGAAAKGAGFPGAFPGGTTTGAPDLGAVQSSAGPTASQFACGFSSLRVPQPLQ